MSNKHKIQDNAYLKEERQSCQMGKDHTFKSCQCLGSWFFCDYGVN